MSKESLVEHWLRKLNSNRFSASVIVVGICAVGIGSFTGALGTVIDAVGKFKKSREPKFAELMSVVSQYAIKASIERESYDGKIVITPVALFRDTQTLANGKPSGYTYLLCRFTNVSDHPITIGALESDRSRYRLDDPGLGYQPVVTTLYQFQMFVRGQPIVRNSVDSDSAFVNSSTIEGGKTKYGYVNSLGAPWPSEMTLTIIDATDSEAGKAKLRIHLDQEGQTSGL